MPPRIHVQFQGYTLSFTIKDIDKSLSLLAESGDSLYAITSGLDSAVDKTIDLYPGSQVQFQNKLQPLMQNVVGAFLLMAGHAYIQDKKHRKMTEILADVQSTHGGDEIYVLFFDPRNNKLLFSGSIPADLYNRDLGID